MDVKLFSFISIGVGGLCLLVFPNLTGIIGVAGAILLAAILIILITRFGTKRFREGIGRR